MVIKGASDAMSELTSQMTTEYLLKYPNIHSKKQMNTKER